ncbi:MAG TPA: hypothetical protein VFM29_09315, partial [Vicinamibacteria bacterium]|nr:hypothetical protein [Vicinamibacteria bacterium]
MPPGALTARVRDALAKGDRRWAAAVLAVAAAIFWEPLLTGRVFYERDIGIVWYPRVESIVRAVAEGAWPVWDPLSGFGLPALADPSYQIAYPLTWLNLVLLPHTCYKVYAFVHCAGAGLGVLVLLRQWGIRGAPAALGGAALTASGTLLSFVSVLHHLAGAAWMPWVLAAVHRVVERPGLRTSCVLGATVAGQVLAGSGDMCLVAGLLAAGYVPAVRLAIAPALRPPVPRAMLALVGAALPALLLSAAQWLPTAMNLAVGSRLSLSRAANTYWSLHPLGLLDAVVPGLVQVFPMSVELRALLLEGRESFLTSLYLGVPVLSLAALGAVLRGPALRYYAAGAGAFFLLAAMGRHTPFYALLLGLPPVRLLRYPVKYSIA